MKSLGMVADGGGGAEIAYVPLKVQEKGMVIQNT
jgi:hypothetical protein